MKEQQFMAGEMNELVKKHIKNEGNTNENTEGNKKINNAEIAPNIINQIEEINKDLTSEHSIMERIYDDLDRHDGSCKEGYANRNCEILRASGDRDEERKLQQELDDAVKNNEEDKEKLIKEIDKATDNIKKLEDRKNGLLEKLQGHNVNRDIIFNLKYFTQDGSKISEVKSLFHADKNIVDRAPEWASHVALIDGKWRYYDPESGKCNKDEEAYLD